MSAPQWSWHTSLFYVSAGHLNSGLHVCTPSTLPTKSSPQPPKWLLTYPPKPIYHDSGNPLVCSLGPGIICLLQNDANAKGSSQMPLTQYHTCYPKSIELTLFWLYCSLGYYYKSNNVGQCDGSKAVAVSLMTCVQCLGPMW